jgi:hypothetical protein
MTEQEWLTSEDPVAMLDYVTCRAGNVPLARPEHLPSDRKLRLFACACCRQERPLRTAVLRAVVLAERFADGGWDRDEAAAALDMSDPEYRLCWTLANGLAPDAALTALDKYVRSRASQAALLRDVVGNPFRQTCLCGAGAPHDDCPRAARLRTPAVLSLALAAYEERRGRCDWCGGSGKGVGKRVVRRDPGPNDVSYSPCMKCDGDGSLGGTLDAFRLALVADALEESGCTDVALLAHLRSPGPHYRGMRSLDLILGKS